MNKVSFFQLMEHMSVYKEESEHTPAMEAIDTGLNLSDDFWDHFMLLCNNTNAVSELLGVRQDVVAGWGAKIKHNLEKVNKAKTNHGTKSRTKVLDTGNML